MDDIVIHAAAVEGMRMADYYGGERSSTFGYSHYSFEQ
jgi:hypothetical protein